MTSTNDGKDVKSNETNGPRGKKYHIELYKSLEARLSSEDTLDSRTEHVCEAWRHVYSVLRHSTASTHPHLLSWLQRHTALTILQSKWQSAPNKDELHSRLSAAIDGLVREATGRLPWEEALVARARWFRGALANPWGHPVLASLLNDPDQPLSDQEVLEWLKEERGVVFVSRVMQLAASKQTNDLALALVGAVMDRARASRPPPADDERADGKAETNEDTTSFYSVLRREAGFLEVWDTKTAHRSTQEVWDLLTDIEFVLLHKREKRARCIELAKQTPLRDGYQLVERLRRRLETEAPRDKKLWKNAKEVATLIAQVIIARCMVVSSCAGGVRTALYSCARSLARLVPGARLPAVTAALAAPAATARHLHTLCAAIHAQCEGEMKPFVCELYVRSITAGMNELERLKLNAEKQAEARSTEKTLATWFLQLGNILGASARLRAECALTAFSVHPAPEMYERVRLQQPPPTTDQQQDKATEPSFNSWAHDSRTQSNLVKTSETLQLKHTPRQANVLSTAILTEGEALGLEPELGQDLAVLLSGPRVKTLSWDMDRELLLENCRAYMDRTHGGTKALTTELKYLNLDLSAFQHLPEEGDDENDIYYGIEKGYEHLVQIEEPEEIWQTTFFDPEQTESADSDPEYHRKLDPVSSGDEDPLSHYAEAKRERSKERKTQRDSKDRERRKHKEKKNKKERKKKSEGDAPNKEEKRGRKKKERRRNFCVKNSVTDSDYDSQSKTQDSVQYDGVFSMDELKSPERRSSENTNNPSTALINSSSPTAINKIISEQIPAFNKNKLELSNTQKAKSSTSSDSDVSRSRSPYLTPNQIMNRHVVNEKVKRSISKLLQFRRTKNAMPKNPVASSKTDSVVPSTQLSSIIRNEPSVELDKKQTQQLEAMNHLLNTAMDIKNSEIRKTSYFDTPGDYSNLMSPQNMYNIQKEAMHYMSQNVHNANAYSENRNVYSEYLQTSPHKSYSNYQNMSNQPSRPASVIDTSYISPTKQANKYYGLNTTPPKPENRLQQQTFHKSMQNLSQMDSVKTNQSPTLSELYYHQYTDKLDTSLDSVAKSLQQLLGNEKPTNSQDPSTSTNIQQYGATSKTNDNAKPYQGHTDSRISHSTKGSVHSSRSNTNSSSSKHLSNSMQNLVNEALAVQNSMTRKYSAPQANPGHNTTTMSNYNHVPKVSRDIPATSKPKTQQVHSKPEKPIKNPPPKPQVRNTPLTEETQSSFKEFLKELQDTINAGVNDTGNFGSLCLNNQVKVTPLKPADRSCAPKAETSAKQTKPQKTETAPNTFSRLSYMHKNKQSEIKKESHPDKELNLLNKNILDHKISKAKYIKHEVTISRVPKQSPVAKTGNAQGNLQNNNPVLSNMLSSSSGDAYKALQSNVIANKTQKSDSIDREHADLLLLLRNQQMLPNVNTRVSNEVDPKHKVCNTQTNEVPAAYQRFEDQHQATNKKEPVIVHNPNPKESTKNVVEPQDWESVMNALREHKTQPLGPKALDIALEKDKKSTQSTSTKSHTSHKQRPSSSQNNNEYKKRDHSNSKCNSSTHKPSIAKHETQKVQSRTEVIKKIPHEAIRRNESPKQYINDPLKQVDPFISGIPNSDYDLLEELMDDDLRQEIGELSSDEERFQAQTISKVKVAVPKTNNVCTKTNDLPKAKPPVEHKITCKNAKLSVQECNRNLTAGYTNVIVNPVLPDSRPENRPAVLCSNIEPQHMVANVIPNPGNHYVANIPSTHMEPANLIITQMPQQPMVLISQEFYDPYPRIHIQETQVSAGLCNVTPNAFVALNPTPNIALYQTTQFAAPVINPVFIGNAMTTTTNVTNATEPQQHKLDKPQQQISPNKVTNLVENKPTQFNQPAQLNQTTRLNQPTQQNSIVAENQQNPDINMNKCSERKVLSQMQDNNSISTSEKDHIRRSSLDRTPLKSKQDEERLKMKRQALMNREINHACFHPPIPLSYTPLSKKRNIDKLIEQTTPKNGAVTTTLKLRSSSTIATKDVTVKTNLETPKSESNNENIEASQTSSTKENKKKPCVFLRSFSKSKTAPRKLETVPLCRNKLKSTEPPKKVVENESQVDSNKTKTETKAPTRISKRILNKTTAKIDSSTTTENFNEVHGNKEKTNEDKPNSEKLNPELQKVPESGKDNSSLEKANPNYEKPSHLDIIKSDNALSGSNVSTISSKPTREVVKEVAPSKENQVANKITQTSKDDTLRVIREKSVISKDTKLVSSANNIEKLKTNLGDKIIIKSSVSKPTSREPIVMTIKNQNQAILSSSKHMSEEIQSKVNHVLPKIAASSVEMAPPKSVSTTFSKTKSLKLLIAESKDRKSDANNVNHENNALDVQRKEIKEAGSIVNKEQKKLEVLKTNVTPVNKRSLLKSVETADKTVAKEITAKPKYNRHVIPIVFDENDTVKEIKAPVNSMKKSTSNDSVKEIKALVNSMQKPTSQVKVSTIRNENQELSANTIAQPMKPSNQIETAIGNKNFKREHEIINLVSNSKISQAQSNKDSDIPHLNNNGVVIEEIPLINNTDPTKRCVRIKIPNGKVFKATVSSKIKVDYDVLFADPAMRNILKEGLGDGKRYTLGITTNHVFKTQNPTKILDTKIRKINIKEKVIPNDTVNLISDDEEDEKHSFSTEFGKFPTNIDLETLKKHQKKFDQKCSVKLTKDDIFKSNRTRPKPKPKSFPSTPISLLTRNKSKLVAEMQNNNVTVPQEPTHTTPQHNSLPPVDLNATKPNTEETIPTSSLIETNNIPPKNNKPGLEVIEIDDSSSDCEEVPSLLCTETMPEPVGKIDELKNMLLKDLGVLEKHMDKPKAIIPYKEKKVVNLKCALLEDLGVCFTPTKQPEKPVTTTTANREKNNVKNCFVKITKCEELIKKYELIRNAKNCFVKLKRCNLPGLVTNTEASIKSDNDILEPSSEGNDDFIDFDVEESRSPQLSRCPSLSILNDLWDGVCLQTTESLYGCSSPVMEIFDALVSLRDKSEDKIELVEITEPLKIHICNTEWTMTKYEYSIQEKTDTKEIKEINGVTQKDDVEKVQKFTAPRLVTIVLKFLENNSDVVHEMHSVRIVKKKALKNTSNNLKRKTEQLVDNNIACKILKLGTIVINAINTYSEKTLRSLTVKSFKEETHVNPVLPVDRQVNDNENLEIESHHVDSSLAKSSSITEEQKVFELSQKHDESIDGCDLVLTKDEALDMKTDNPDKRETDISSKNRSDEQTEEYDSSNVSDVLAIPNEPKEVFQEDAQETDNVLNAHTKVDEQSFDDNKQPFRAEILNATEEINGTSSRPQTEPMNTNIDDQEKITPIEVLNSSETIKHNSNNEDNVNLTEVPANVVRVQLSYENVLKSNDLDPVIPKNTDHDIVVENVLTGNCETYAKNTNNGEDVDIIMHQREVLKKDSKEHHVTENEAEQKDNEATHTSNAVDNSNKIGNAENSEETCVMSEEVVVSSDTVKCTTDRLHRNACDKVTQLEKFEPTITNEKSVRLQPLVLTKTKIDHVESVLSNNTDTLVEEQNDSNIKNYATLVEIPICEMHNEVYEVEIMDSNLEDNVEIKDTSNALNAPELVVSNTVSSAQDSCDLTSPVFIDNKEIVFNYHDYTKKPKPKNSYEEQTSHIDNKTTAQASTNINYIYKDKICEGTIENVSKSKPERKYELIQEDDWLTVITTEHDTAESDARSSIVKANSILDETERVTSPYSESSGVTLKGIEIEDPEIGTCYVFTLNESGSTESSNVSSENIEYQENGEDERNVNTVLYKDLHDIELCVIAPKMTYSRKHLKRKMDMRDIKVTTKKYRKGKNIDCSKRAITSIIECAYSKEYKRLLDYWSSVKFSYSRPFHKECIEVDRMITNWPINKKYTDVPEDGPDENLFVDVEITPLYQPDPATQTLVEEITYQYERTDALQENPSLEAHETNFDMGFGDGSGRVIQNLKNGGDSNISAATLSDVKQTQPVFTSEDHDNCAVPTTVDDQIKKIRQYVSFIELRDKVRSFFKKTSVELKLDWIQNVKEKSRYSDRSVVDFPYDLCSLDYVKPPPTDTIVQVVQLGQLPVSAAAQNPVTCDPRVTQVSDASPSQCSVDNSPNDDSQSEIKTEYTELKTADLTLPIVQEYAQNQIMNLDSHDANDLEFTEQTISLEMEIKEEIPEATEESNSVDNADLQTLTNATPENIEYLYDNSSAKTDSNNVYESSEPNNTETFSQQRQQNGSTEKTDQIAHAMNAAGITTMPESLNNSRAHALVNILSQKIRQGSVNTTQTTTNTYSKTTSINAMALQQALAQILPPPLNQTGENNQTASNVGPQVLHIVQGKNSSGNQITLVDNSQQSVISTPNATQVLHIVQNKGSTTGQASNGTLSQQPNSFSGLSLVDAGLQQGGNQLLHIVNTGNQKNANAGQLLKRVNLLTNLANVQGSNEQKMVQFVCKSADGKAIQLNAPHQRSMVLRLQPIETCKTAKPAESQELSPSPTNSASNKETANQQEIKSRSIYEENYAKFIQNSSSKTPNTEKSTSLPKFNQAFGKAVFQEGSQKPAEAASDNAHMAPVNTHTENPECPPTDNAINLEAMRQISSPPLLIRKPVVTTQSQSNIVQQIKQTIAPMNIQTMHGGVIYTRQIPVNIGGGQTINLITVPSTELINDESKPQTANQSEGEPSIIKIVPQNQNTTNTEGSHEENNAHINATNETAPTPQPQPVLTQMRIKLPMLSKAPQMVPGARVVRPSFFQIQRNVIGGANQPVYQQLVLTAAPPLGQQTIRLPQAQATRSVKVPSESQSSSSETQMSTSTLEQLREFDMVLEQVKERSTVQPGTTNSTFKLQGNSPDATDGNSSSNCSSEPTQVLYSIGNNQSLNVAYVNRKSTVTTPTTSTFVRSPDSTGIADSPTSSTHAQIPHTVTSDSSPTDMTSQSKPAKVGSKSKSRPKSSSNPPNTLKLNSVPPKTSSQKPLEDEQTTQRILYILAEYKEQVENSPDKDKPAPRRRSNPPSNPGSSKRKKSSSSRRSGTRDMSPVHGEDTCRTMGSEDSSCGTSQGDCNESCLDGHSPQDSPRKVARKITFDQEPAAQPRPPQRNVIVADGQTITVARSTTGKPATAVLMPANYILPVSMVKGGQQIAIVTNRGPKLLTVGGGEAGAANALLLQRLIGPGGLKPVLARPGVRQVRLPTAALHNLQAFNLATATVQPPDSTASPTPGPTPPELVDTRATSSPWTDREEVKPERGSSPEGSEPWNLPSSADAHEYSYEETVRTDNIERTVLVVQKKDGTHRHHRISHVSAAALRHKYAILEHELRLQKSLSEECEDLGVDSPSASELFPEAELLFAASPAHEHAQEHDHAPPAHQSTIPQPDIDDQIATDQLLPRDVALGLDAAPLDHEEFARAHPNTTFTSEPDAEVQPFTITGLKGRHITSTIFHSNSAPATVLMAAPSVITQPEHVKYEIEGMINMPHDLTSLVKDDGLTRLDTILTDRELHLSNTASAIVHPNNATQVIRRVCYEDDKRERDARYLIDEPDNLIAGDDAKMVAEDTSSRDATLESMADADDDRSSPERHAELFWESNSASERSESRRPLDFSSDSDKCCKSPFEETNSTDSSVGAHLRLDSVIKEARGRERSGSAGSDDHPPLRTYPPKRPYHADGESVSGKTRAGERSPDGGVRRRASGRGVVKRGCHCCSGSPLPARAKKPRQRKPTLDFIN